MMSDSPMITFMRQPKPSSDYVTTRTRVARMSVTPTRNCFVRKKTNHTLGEPSESMGLRSLPRIATRSMRLIPSLPFQAESLRRCYFAMRVRVSISMTSEATTKP
jgi:hypothetical protein